MLLDIDFSVLSNKLKINTKRVVKAWKAGKSDQEIVRSLGVEQWKLNTLRRELMKARWQITLKRKNMLPHNKTGS